MNNANRRLLEADVLRPVAVLLVVLLHSFTIYWGKWTPPEGFVQFDPYKWIAASSFSFTMELFVLLSGYVFGYQLLVLRKDFTISSLAKNKFKRLIVPSLIFGVVYALIFYQQRTFLKAAYAVVKGAGHLWFLPMLFWCFIFSFMLYKAEIKEKSKFIILLACVAMSAVSFPLRIDKALYYLFFFYLGLKMIQNQDLCRKLCMNRYVLLSAAIVWLSAFISYEIYVPGLMISANDGIFETAVKVLNKYWVFLYSFSGTMFFFLLAFRLMQNRTSVPSYVLFLSSVSFGIYLFHQIIIEVLYYKTSLPVLVGPYWLPWIGFLISLAGSVLLVLLVRKMKIQFLSI